AQGAVLPPPPPGARGPPAGHTRNRRAVRADGDGFGLLCTAACLARDSVAALCVRDPRSQQARAPSHTAAADHGTASVRGRDPVRLLRRAPRSSRLLAELQRELLRRPRAGPQLLLVHPAHARGLWAPVR